jgi:hypothetical protein
MFRRLRAIEIAEGALLADIAVVFQVLTIYLPVGHGFFTMLIFVVFAVLVLRQGLYVGILGMCVALFIVGVVTGPQHLVVMLIAGTGGLFLGITMKRRFHHIPLLLLGITSGAFTLYVLIPSLYLLAGLPLTSLVRGLHQAYDTVIPLMNLIASRVGLGNWWKQSVYPTVASLAALGFTYWWILFYLALWAFLCPVVTGIYAVTNLFVRLLGYDVRPFPDGWLRKLLYRLTSRIVRIAVKRGMLKRGGDKSSKMQEQQKKQMKQGVNV